MACNFDMNRQINNKRAPPYNSNDYGCRGLIKPGVDNELYMSVPNKSGQFYWKKMCSSNTFLTSKTTPYSLIVDNTPTAVYLQKDPSTSLVAPFLYPTADPWVVINGEPTQNMKYVDLNWIPLQNTSYDAWLAQRNQPAWSSIGTAITTTFTYIPGLNWFF